MLESWLAYVPKKDFFSEMPHIWAYRYYIRVRLQEFLKKSSEQFRKHFAKKRFSTFFFPYKFFSTNIKSKKRGKRWKVEKKVQKTPWKRVKMAILGCRAPVSMWRWIFGIKWMTPACPPVENVWHMSWSTR